MSNLLEQLKLLGFKEHDHFPHFGYKIPYVDYLFKQKKNGNYVYVSISNYKGEFCAAFIEEYLVLKNTRVKGKNNEPKHGEYSEFHKKGFLPISMKSILNEDDILKYIINE